jgi:aminoglycoside phosphotransferase (APT) family kinase protein
MGRTDRQLWLRSTLASAGFDASAPLERVQTVTNEVWRNDDVVVRINGDSTPRLRREAWIASHLPPEVGYPPIVAHGNGGSSDWMLQRRLPGRALAHAWPDLSPADRRTAVRDLASRLRALHATAAPVGGPSTRVPHLLGDDPDRVTEPLLAGLHEAGARSLLDAGLVRDLITMVGDAAAAMRPYPVDHLVHGDLTFENVLCDGGRVTSVLDLEFARGGPPDLDLDVVLRMCAHPELHVQDRVAARSHADDYAEVPSWLAEDHPAMFAHPALPIRCRVFSIAYDVADVLEYPPPSVSSSLPPFHAVNRLKRTAAGTCHLSRFLGELVPR